MTTPLHPAEEGGDETVVIGVSPHSDDVALSITHTLNALGRLCAPVRFELITCFSQSDYTVFDAIAAEGSVADLRAEEDRLYLAGLDCASCRLASLGLLDAPLRPEWDEGAHVEDLYAYEVTDAEIDRYGPVLERLLRERRHDVGLHFAPLGISHKDHLIGHHAAIAAFGDLPLILYEDCPYIFIRSSDETRSRMNKVKDGMGYAPTPLQLRDPFDLDAWIRCVSVYRSQFAPQDLVAIGEMMRDKGGEILWANAQAMDWLEDRKLLPQFVRADGSHLA